MAKKTVATIANIAGVENVADVFGAALDGFRKSVTEMQNFGRICAETGLRHFYAHQDTVYLQRFLDTMEEKALKNSTRPTAFKTWLREFAPITMKDGKLVKDQSRAEEMFANAADLLEKACATPYWDFAPDKEQIAWGEDDIVKKLRQALKPFEKEDGPGAANATAIHTLGKAKQLVEQLASEVAVHKLQHGPQPGNGVIAA